MNNNNATQTNLSDATLYNVKRTKIEKVTEALLTAGPIGLSRWQILGKFKASNPGTFANSLRKRGIGVTTGKQYSLIDKIEAIKAIKFINEMRQKRNEKPLERLVIDQCLTAFNDVA